MTVFKSAKDAIALVSRLSIHLSYPATRPPSGARYTTLDAVNVRICMKAAGVDPESEDALRLYAWATTADQIDCERQSDGERDLLTLVKAIKVQLLAAGLLEPPRLRAMRVAWRVLEIDGDRRVLVVLDPDYDRDPELYRSKEHARRVANREVEGPVQLATRDTMRRLPPHRERELRRIWTQDGARKLGDLDQLIAQELGVSRGTGRRIRLSWGLKGVRGKRSCTD